MVEYGAKTGLIIPTPKKCDRVCPPSPGQGRGAEWRGTIGKLEKTVDSR